MGRSPRNFCRSAVFMLLDILKNLYLMKLPLNLRGGGGGGGWNFFQGGWNFSGIWEVKLPVNTSMSDRCRGYNTTQNSPDILVCKDHTCFRSLKLAP